jgi:hypothetical protein
LESVIMSDQKQSIDEDRIAKALDAGVPQIYFNAFVNGISSCDVISILERNGKPVAILNMSYTLAKTISVSLGQIISQFEAGVERPMLTTQDVDTALERARRAADVAKKESK